MKHKIGITLDERVKREIILESLKVLSSIEKKYNVKFELTNELGSSKLRLKVPTIRKKSKNKSTGLYSFGGEMEV